MARYRASQGLPKINPLSSHEGDTEVPAVETEVVERIRRALNKLEAADTPENASNLITVNSSSTRTAEAKCMGLTAILFGLRLIELAVGIPAN